VYTYLRWHLVHSSFLLKCTIQEYIVKTVCTFLFLSSVFIFFFDLSCILYCFSFKTSFLFSLTIQDRQNFISDKYSNRIVSYSVCDTPPPFVLFLHSKSIIPKIIIIQMNFTVINKIMTKIHSIIYHLLEESRSIRSHAFRSASLNLFCICWTQSRPVTNMRAIMRGSCSCFDSSNSCRA